MGDIKFELEAETSGAEKGVAKFFNLLNQTDTEMAELAKTSRKAEKAARKTFEGASRGAKTAKDKINGTKTAMDGVDKLAKTSLTSVKSWVGGFAGLAGIKMLIGEVISGLRETQQIQNEMLSTSIELDRLALPLAGLYKDTSQAGIDAARGKIMSAATQAKVTPEVAEQALFFSVSAMGAGPAAEAAGLKVAKSVGSLGLSNEDGAKLIRILSLLEANTGEKQDKVLNMVLTAANRSIAQTGDYVSNLPQLLAEGISRGYDPAEILAKYNSAIAVTGSPSQAATTARSEIAILSGRSKQAIELWSELAKKQGLDFAEMTDPQRVAFSSGEFLKILGTKRVMEFKGKLGGEGYGHLLVMGSSKAKSTYAADLPAIGGAASGTFAADAWKGYSGTRIAEQVGIDTMRRGAEARTGVKKAPSVVFNTLVEDIFAQKKAGRRGIPEHIGAFFTPETIEKRNIAQRLMHRNLDIAQQRIEERHGGVQEDFRDDPEFIRINALREEAFNVLSYRASSDFLRRASEATQKFTLIQEEGLHETAPRDIPINRAIESWFKLDQAADKLNEAAEKITVAAEKLDGSSAAGDFGGGGDQ